MRAYVLGALSLVAALAASPSSAAAQQDGPTDALRLSPYFLLGFGDADIDTAGFGSTEADLDPTVGLGVRFEAPVWDYITIGGVFAWAAFRVDQDGADRDHVFDFDPFVKGRYVLDAGGMPLELYALLPVGLSVASFDADNTDAGIGWNIGLLFGGSLFVTDSIGIFAELGFMHHSLDSEVDSPVGVGSADFDVSATQGRMHLGASFAF